MHDPNRPAPWLGAGDANGDLLEALAALIEGEPDPLACLASVAAAVFHALPDLNWAGFYLRRGGDLVVGPFQGLPACTRIPLGRGVCGTAAAGRRSVLVPDVDAFPGHIACDTGSRSELVVPVLAGGRAVGVLDLDSPRRARFTPADQMLCERIAALVAPFVHALADN